MRPIVTRYNISLTLAHPCFESDQDVERNRLQEENSQPVQTQWHVVDFFICRIKMQLVQQVSVQLAISPAGFCV